MTIKRLGHGPIIYPELDASIGTNINGPSLIRVPDWLPDRFGTYYLYFGHHQGKYIRLAYADRLEGPWTIYKPGTLQLKETPCHGHIASPDVHIDNANQRIIMYYHGPILDKATAAQTRLTQSGFQITKREFESGFLQLTATFFKCRNRLEIN